MPLNQAALTPVLQYTDNGDGTYAPVPTPTPSAVETATVTIEWEHNEIHEGDAYSAQIYDADTDIATPKTFRVQAPNTTKRLHCVWSMSCGASGGLWELYEGPTVNAAGSAVTPVNRSRNSTNTATGAVFQDDTYSALGTLIWAEFVGANGAVFKAGGNARSDSEFILKQNTAYLMRFTATVDNTICTIRADWYEV
jgi:hypothetical protein